MSQHREKKLQEAVEEVVEAGGLEEELEPGAVEPAAVRVRFGTPGGWRLVTPEPGESKIRAGLRAVEQARLEAAARRGEAPEVVARGTTWYLICC